MWGDGSQAMDFISKDVRLWDSLVAHLAGPVRIFDLVMGIEYAMTMRDWDTHKIPKDMKAWGWQYMVKREMFIAHHTREARPLQDAMFDLKVYDQPAPGRDH
jgi:hypothetical protein